MFWFLHIILSSEVHNKMTPSKLVPLYPFPSCKGQGSGLRHPKPSQARLRSGELPGARRPSWKRGKTLSLLKAMLSLGWDCYSREKVHSSSNVPCQLGSGSWTFKFSLNSKHVSPMKEVREEVPNLQENNCEACGEKFETEDNLDTHVSHGCHHCKQIFLGCQNSSSKTCPDCYTPWPNLQSHLASLSWEHGIVLKPILRGVKV